MPGSLTEQDTAPWSGITAIAELKARPGKDILTFGSRVLGTDLLAASLVEELYLMAGHAVRGGGTPASAQPRSLRLLDTRHADGSDNEPFRVTVGDGT